MSTTPMQPVTPVSAHHPEFAASPSQPNKNNPETGWTREGTSTGIRFAGTPSWPAPGVETLSRTEDPYHSVQPFFGFNFRFPSVADGSAPTADGARDPYGRHPTRRASEGERDKTITNPRKEWIA